MTDHINEPRIREELAKIAASRVFVNSPTLISFLRLVVERTLDGKIHEVKGPTIAAEVYGRDIVGNPAEDSIVRVEAVRLRKKLAEYYATEGQSDPVKIAIPKGAYVPTFEMPSAAQPIPLAEASTPTVEPRKPARSILWYPLSIALLVVVSAAFSIAIWARRSREKVPIDYRVDGNVLKTLDAQGEVVWQYALPRPVSPDAYARTAPYLTLPQHERGGVFADLAGRGKRDFLLAYGVADEQTTLFCFGPDGIPTWSVRLGGAVRTTKGQSILGHYQVNGIAVLKQARADGGRLLFQAGIVSAGPRKSRY